MKEQIGEKIIGQVKRFNGIFKLYQTDNIFQFIQQTKKDILKDEKDDIDGSTIMKFGRIQPNVQINAKGVIVGILNKKEGLFVCKKYSLLIPDGWTVVDDVATADFNMKKFKIKKFLKKNESYISGEELRKRAIDLKANLGFKVLEYVLEHQSQIPEEFRNYWIYFTGTLLRRPDGVLCVACLYFDGDRWVLRFAWLDDFFDSNDRLAIIN